MPQPPAPTCFFLLLLLWLLVGAFLFFLPPCMCMVVGGQTVGNAARILCGLCTARDSVLKS